MVVQSLFYLSIVVFVFLSFVFYLFAFWLRCWSCVLLLPARKVSRINLETFFL